MERPATIVGSRRLVSSHSRARTPPSVASDVGALRPDDDFGPRIWMINSWRLSADRSASAPVSWLTSGLFCVSAGDPDAGGARHAPPLGAHLVSLVFSRGLGRDARHGGRRRPGVRGRRAVRAGTRASACCRRPTLAFALALPVSHVANLVIPFPSVRGGSAAELAALAIATLVLTIPFVLSGLVVTLALTRTRAPIGLLYGADLLGAAAGCLAIIWLLELTDITSTALVDRRRRGDRRRRASLGTPAGAATRPWLLGRRAVRRGRGQRDGGSAAGHHLSQEPQPLDGRARDRLLGVERPLQRDRSGAGGRSGVPVGPGGQCARGRGHDGAWPRSTATRGPSSPSGTANPASLGWVQIRRHVAAVPDSARRRRRDRRRRRTRHPDGDRGGQYAHHRHRDQQGARRTCCKAGIASLPESRIIPA